MPKQFLDEDGLAIVASKVNEKLKVLATMPSTDLTDGLTILYKGATTATYKQGHIYKYDLANTAWVDITAGGIPAVTTMPSTPNNDDVVLYIGTTTSTYTANHLYRYNSTDAEWADLTATVLALYKTTFQGTKAEWDLLSSAEKEQYDVVNLTDDIAEGGAVVVDEVTAGNLNAVTSNAVHSYIVYQDYEVKTSTSTQSAWAPFTYYHTFEIAKTGYRPIYAQIISASTNHGIAWFNDAVGSCYVALQADPSTVNVTVRITYMKTN